MDRMSSSSWLATKRKRGRNFFLCSGYSFSDLTPVSMPPLMVLRASSRPLAQQASTMSEDWEAPIMMPFQALPDCSKHSASSGSCEQMSSFATKMGSALLLKQF